jgi:DNA-binding NtrC family response regulator
MAKVLVVDDEGIIRKGLCEIVSSEGFQTCEASGGKAALLQFQKEKPDLALLDMKMPDISGLEVLRELKKINPGFPVIIVTAFGDIPSAVEAIKEGAYDFLTKPLNSEKLLLTIRRALDKVNLEKRVQDLDNTLRLSLETMFGRSEPVKLMIDGLCRIVGTDFSILILGETGTGKTYLANMIHNLSARAHMRFVKVSIGSIPEGLIESELFGHDKGAFTGAERSRCGYFESADKGTLFIDDLDNIPVSVQGKLLSSIEDKKIYPIGSTSSKTLDIRIIGATNTDLTEAVRKGLFREDLYYRMSEFVIKVPPLRDRKEDIVFFAEKFIADTCSELNKPTCVLNGESLTELQSFSFHWPGNLRQLKNVMRRAVLLSPGDIIEAANIAFLIGQDSLTSERYSPPDIETVHDFSLKESERAMIERALAHTGGKKLKAASLLGITYNTLIKKMTNYRIS